MAAPRTSETRVGYCAVPSTNVTARPGRYAAGVSDLRGAAALGDTVDWGQWYAEPREVYVWRSPVAGARIESPGDARAILRAVARASDLKLDVRGIVWGKYRASGHEEEGVDVVMTADTTIPYAVPQTAGELGRAAAADPALRRRFPELVFHSARFGGPRLLQLTAPADAVDFWLAHPIVYDDKIGPMDAFAKMAGIYKGEADDGPRLSPWKSERPDLGGGGGKLARVAKDHWLLLLGLGAAAAYAGAKLLGGKNG